MKPILSVVIPTHNRSKYAYHCILSILNIIDDKCELVISDTSDNTILFDQLTTDITKTINNPKLKYFHPDFKLDMTGNHNYAISKAQGEYICLIGDDDTITVDAINAAIWAFQNDIDVIAPKVLTNYVWPDFRSLVFKNSHSSRLYLPKRLGKIKKVNSVTAISNFLNNSAQGTDNLPKIYHGIVKKTLLDKIYNITGNYFFGSSPDVSGAVALSLCSDYFLEVSFPLTIPGASGGSNTGRSALNKHKGELKDETQTSSFINSGWSNLVPEFFSVETVWAHAAIETISNIDKKLLEKFNFEKLIALCEIKHPEFKEEINKSKQFVIDLKHSNTIIFKYKILYNKLIYFINRVKYIAIRGLVPTAAGGRKYIGNIENIELASIEYNKYREKSNWSWQNYITKLWY